MTQVLAQFRLVPFRIGGFRGEVVNLFSGVLRLVDAFDLWAVKKRQCPNKGFALAPVAWHAGRRGMFELLRRSVVATVNTHIIKTRLSCSGTLQVSGSNGKSTHSTDSSRCSKRETNIACN